MLHIGYWEETGKRCLIGSSCDWANYLREKSNKSLYYFLRRNHYDKQYMCEILAPFIDDESKTENEIYEDLMKNKTYMQIIEDYREELIEGIEEEIEAF